MEDLEHLNELYLSFEEVVDILRKELNVTFTEALVETFDNLEHKKIKVEANAPSAKIVELLTKKYANLEYEKLETSVKSHLFYLLTLKAADVDNFNSTQLPTPRILATIVALLWSKIVPQTAKEVIDPAIGSGTLLTPSLLWETVLTVLIVEYKISKHKTVIKIAIIASANINPLFFVLNIFISPIM